MQQTIRYVIRFEGMDAVEAGQSAEALQRSIQELDPTIETSRVRTDTEAMDFGSSLAVGLAAPSILALAKGIANWLARTHSSKITITDDKGKVVVENISARQATELAEKLQARHGSR